MSSSDVTPGSDLDIDQSSVSERPIVEMSKCKRGKVPAEAENNAPARAKCPRLTHAPQTNNPDPSLPSHLEPKGHKLDVESQRKTYHQAENDGTSKRTLDSIHRFGLRKVIPLCSQVKQLQLLDMVLAQTDNVTRSDDVEYLMRRSG